MAGKGAIQIRNSTNLVRERVNHSSLSTFR
jgi:hypothetical protein